MSYQFTQDECRDLSFASGKEWLLTNGIGGFAMGTVSGVNTRRYHGLLIAALTPPTERTLLFAACDAFAIIGKKKIPLSSNQYPGAIYPNGYQFLSGVQVDENVTWRFEGDGVDISKSITIEPGKNAVKLEITNHGKKAITIQLVPLVCFRDFHSNFVEREDFPAKIEYDQNQTVIEEGNHSFTLFHSDALRRPVHGWYYRFEHQREIERGLNARDDLYCPCELEFLVKPSKSCSLIGSLEIAHDVDVAHGEWKFTRHVSRWK